MKKALISPLDVPVNYISGWTDQTPAEPIFTNIENAYRVSEVSTQTFDVAEPLFWVDCSDEVVADQWYFNFETGDVLPKQNAPSPNPPLPG